MDRYRVRVAKEDLTFSSGHFIVLGGTQCESLHGHNFRVAAEIEGPLNGDFLVLDFVALRAMLLGIVEQLDHRVIVPLRSPSLDVQKEGTSVSIRHRAKRWLLPAEDCVLLPIEGTTSELLGRWISGRLREEIAKHAARATGQPSPAGEAGGDPGESLRVSIEVEESPGQSAIHETVVPTRALREAMAPGTGRDAPIP